MSSSNVEGDGGSPAVDSRSENVESAPDTVQSSEGTVTSGAEGDIRAPPSQGKEAKKEGAVSGGHVASPQSSKQLAGSNKLEDQINLQHLVELMKIFYVWRHSLSHSLSLLGPT